MYYAYSTDDGRTWSKNVRITDQSVDRRVGVWGQNYDIASQPGVGSTEAYAVFGWDDIRNTDRSIGDNNYLGGGVQDIYIAAAQFEAIGHVERREGHARRCRRPGCRRARAPARGGAHPATYGIGVGDGAGRQDGHSGGVTPDAAVGGRWP